MSDVLVMYKSCDFLPMVMEEEHIKAIKCCTKGNVYWCKDEKEALDNGYDAEVLFIWGGSGTMPETYCAQSKKLKWIHSFSAGVNPIMACSISNLPVKLTNAKGIHGKTMALTTGGYIINFLRYFPELQRRQEKHIWSKKFASSPKEPDGMTVGIIGAGAIGTEVAKITHALNMKNIGVKRTVQKLDFFDEMYSNADMDLVLQQSDFVVIVTPLTDATYHLFDKEKFKIMKKTAVVINIARGPVINEEDLIWALKNGEIGGAALDAVEKEPLDPDSPLWDMENVIITPHCAADSERYMRKAVDQFCRNLIKFESGQELFNEISMRQKY